MENRSHALIAGFFTIALLIIASLLAIWLGRDKIQRIPYEIVTQSAVSGLNLQAAVRYKGLKVGSVTDIDFDTTVNGQIVMRLEVIPTTPITASTYATLAYQGVTGIAFVQLDDDQSSAQPLLATQSGTTLPRIPLHASTLQTIEQRGLAILSQTEELTKRMNSLLDPANAQSLVHTVSSINDVAQAWQAVPAKLTPALNKLPNLIAQTETTLNAVSALSADARQFTRNMNQLSSDLQSRDGPIARLSHSLDALSDSVLLDTLPRLQTLSTEAGTSMRALKRTSETLNDSPQSILFGKPAAMPGPGEAGFITPK
ncbi:MULTISPECIES: MlaD family protein [unclassified Undibacterium]|uniref:MlaD family protein n=1 Tax=unclassified Undibacterium TaxID=2630295 RepID=UPI002AC9D8AA|nr:MULTISPECIES: MlaD family protein [unclassified Undibacterium]MEB0137481.1 MlaD family protein [Undibacterium sp. CCC2.1]MEB0170854.1 MlaD family protein [Undibacterium sp. CCC1.1]MEB0174806.1 MlaD family protein [Undibacterium sp. CCC3.4]MEB0214142.1 MlaD family protein [Undibacterium sp. 5I2]WPX44455.1 MlaD family protein [Undibacterium sp. CCC3.4]